MSTRHDEQLTTLARLSVVAFVCAFAWLTNTLPPQFEVIRPRIHESTVLSCAVAAAMITLFHAVRGPEVRGRSRRIWDGFTLAFATFWLLVTIDTALEAYAA